MAGQVSRHPQCAPTHGAPSVHPQRLNSDAFLGRLLRSSSLIPVHSGMTHLNKQVACGCAGQADIAEAGSEGAVGEAACLCPGRLLRRIHGDHPFCPLGLRPLNIVQSLSNCQSSFVQQSSVLSNSSPRAMLQPSILQLWLLGVARLLGSRLLPTSHPASVTSQAVWRHDLRNRLPHSRKDARLASIWSWATKTRDNEAMRAACRCCFWRCACHWTA